MIDAFVVKRFRALRDIRFEPKRLTLITGSNGAGKSTVYRALTLLQRAATGGLGMAIAQEGGIGSLRWAGVDEASSRATRSRGRRIQGTESGESSNIVIGVSLQGLRFELELGTPGYEPERRSAFNYDPGVARESLWLGEARNRHSICMDRQGPAARCFDSDRNQHLFTDLLATESAVSALRDPRYLPEVHAFREHLRNFRFYDGFRVDAHSPLRQPAIGVLSPVLMADGGDLAACVQTIFEIGDGEGFRQSIREALGAEIEVLITEGPRFEIAIRVDGLLRPLRANELSDGTLRYIALASALFAPRPPAVVIFNEPEASLHPSLLEPLGQAMRRAAEHTQVWIVTHSDALAAVVRGAEDIAVADITLERGEDGATRIRGQTVLERPNWPG